MGRFRVLASFALLVSAALSLATDYRLVVASDDPQVRKAGTMVIFDAKGKVSKNDRITSITFSAAADVTPNCLVSLDPSSGKNAIPVSPDVQVFSGKVMLAGSKPLRKVIPAHISVDVPVPSVPKQSVMSPIIQQVNNLPWVYIALGAGLFMGFMFLMNRRSQQFSTSMSKEAKNLYVETVGRITERLERIEVNQDRLVKNPPVVRTFKAQIEDFESRLTRIEKLAKEGRDEMGKAAAELGQADRRHFDLSDKLDASKAEAAKAQTTLKEEANALRAEMKLILKAQDDAHTKLAALDELREANAQISEQGRKIDAKLAEQLQNLKQAHETQGQQIAKIQGEVSTMRANQESLLSLPAGLESLNNHFSTLPNEFKSIREGLPQLDGVQNKLDGVDSKLDKLNELHSKFDRVDELHAKLDDLPAIRNTVESLPKDFPTAEEQLAKVHESLLRQIEELSGKVEGTGANLGELLNSKTLVAPATEPVAEERPSGKKSKKQKEEPVEAEPESIAEPEIETVAEVIEEPVAATVEEIEAPIAHEEIPEVEIAIEELPIAEEIQPEPEAIIESEVAVEPEPEAPVAEISEIEEVLTEIEPAAEVEIEPSQVPVAEVELEPVAVEAALEEVAVMEPEPQAEPEPEAVEEVPAPVMEFSFSNAVREMAVETKTSKRSAKEKKEPPLSFKLEDLPTHLETFEDGPETVLPTLKLESEDVSKSEELEAVNEALKSMATPTKSAVEDVEAFDGDHEEHGDALMGHWTGFGGSSARTWGSDSSRPLELIDFSGELKPLTPIETAPIGDAIGGIVYGFGRVLYTCGSTIRGFWPGREDRHLTLDTVMPVDEWRLAVKGQTLFIAEEKRVKIASIQGWFVLEQFAGEYRDQLVLDHRWIGLRYENGPTVDFRDFRGQMAAQAVSIDADMEGLRLIGVDRKVFAGSKKGQVFEVSEFGTEKVGATPVGRELLHLTAYQGQPLALLRHGKQLECAIYGEHGRTIDLGAVSYSGSPVLLGHRLYLANVEKSELITINLKKMHATASPAFDGINEFRRLVGVQHKAQHQLFGITSDHGKKGGRLISIDPKSGVERTFGSVGHATVNLIAADHHAVLATSNQYQNVIRILEPFAERVAA
ncbi:MAG TPA: hypothetical protein VJ835_04670 [Fimbriimonadaceae bacterium]|nr:hypothetical protein [Fimbriimonadaceae bacterium]